MGERSYAPSVTSSPRRRIQRICAAFPEVSEVQVTDALNFRVRDRGFAVYWPHWFSDPRPQLWVKAPPGAQEEMITADPSRFFVPAYNGRHGWIGVRLEPPPDDWDELAAMLEVAYRLTAPKRLTERL